MSVGCRRRTQVRKDSVWKRPLLHGLGCSDSSDPTALRVRSYSAPKDDEKSRLPRASSLEFLHYDEHHEVDLNIVRRLTGDMAQRGRKIGTHLQAIHDGVPRDEPEADENEQCLPEDLADELRKRTTSVDSEIKQLENQMGQLQRTLVKGKARRESIKHRISVSASSPGGTRKVSAMTPYLPTPENPSEELSMEELKARLEAMENEKLELLEDKKDLNDEIKFLKYQLQYRLEVQNLQSEKETSMKTESHVKLENENKALREENKDLKDRLNVIRTKLKESGNTEESLLSVTDVSDSEDGRDESSLESELDRLYTERKILLSTIMRMQNLDRDDRRDSISFTDYGVQCDLLGSTDRDHVDGHVTPLVAKLKDEIDALKKHSQEVERENEEMTDENRALDEENSNLVEEKRTLEDTINKLRAQINDTLDTTLDEIEHLHSFNEELEEKLQKSSAQGRELSESMVEFKDRHSKALENLLNDTENKSSVKEVMDHIREEIERLNDENVELREPQGTIKSTGDKTLTANLLSEVKNCKELLESQRSHIRELQMDKRDIEEGYAKMKRELMILRSSRQKDRKKEWLLKRRAKSMNDGLQTDPSMDRTISDEFETLKRDVRRLSATKSELDLTIRNIKKEKATLEEEKVCLLGSLYHQLERNESLEVQVEELTAVLEQWEAKEDLRGSGSDVFSPLATAQDVASQQSGESEGTTQEAGATTDETTKDGTKGEGKDADAHAQTQAGQPIKAENGAAKTEDTMDEISPKISTLGDVVDSTTDESQEMKQKIHALGENLKNVQDSVRDLEIERDKLQEDLEESKKNEKELRNVVIQLKRENSSTKDKLQKANEYAQTLKDCLKEAHDEKEDLVESLEEANEEKIVSKKHSELLDNRLKEVTQQRDALKGENEPLKTENSELKSKYEKAEEKLKEIHKMLDDIGKLAPATEENTEAASEAEKNEEGKLEGKEESEKCIEELGKEIISWLGTVFVDVDRTKKELKRTNNEQNRLKSRLDTVLTERQALQKYVREVDDKKRQMKMFITKLTEEKEKLAVQIDETRQQKINLADALEDVYQSKEKLQHRLDEALCKQDQYKHSLLEAVDEAKTLKESLYRMVNEHETMKESLLMANREIGRLKSQEASPEAEQEEEELEKGQRESNDEKETLKAERNELQQKLNNLSEILESVKHDLEKADQEKEDSMKAESASKSSVDILTRENTILKTQVEEFVRSRNIKDEEEITPAVTTQSESAPGESAPDLPERQSKSDAKENELPKSPGLTGLWDNLSLLATENSQLQERIAGLEKEKEALEKDLTQVCKEKEEKENRIDELVTQNASNIRTEEQADDEEQLKEWYDVVCKEKELLERELESITKDNEDLLHDLKRLQDESAKLAQEKDDLPTAAPAAKEDGIKEDKEVSEDMINALEGELGSATDEIKQLKDLLENERKEKQSVIEVRTELQSKLEELLSEENKLNQEREEEIRSMRTQIEELKKQKEDDCNELQADFEKRLEELVENTDKIVQEKVDLITSLQDQLMLHNQEKDTEPTQEKTSAIQQENERMKQEIKDVLDKCEDLKDSLEKAKTENNKLTENEKKMEEDFERQIKKLSEEKEGLVKENADLVAAREGSEASKQEEEVGGEEKDDQEAEQVNIEGVDIEDELQDALGVYQELKNALEVAKEENEMLKEREEELQALQANSDKKIDELVMQKDKLVKEKIDLVNSLHERMAEISQDKEKFSDDMQVLLDEKKQEIDHLREEKERIEKENMHVKNLLDTTMEDNEELEKSEADLEAMQDELEKVIHELAVDKEKHIMEKAALVNSLHAEKEQLTKTIEKLQEEKNKLHESFINTEQDLEASVRETVALEKQVEMLSRESATMKEEAEERIQKLIELEEKVIVTMEKKLELAEYASTLKAKKESLERKCTELGSEVEGLQKARDELAARKTESEKSLTEKVKDLSVAKEKNEADLVEVSNALRICKQDIEVLKIKLDSVERKNKDLTEELSKVKQREHEMISESLKTQDNAQKTNDETNAKMEEMKHDMKKANEEVEKILEKNNQLSRLFDDLNAGLDSILNEEDISSVPPDSKLEKLKDKLTKLEKQLRKASDEKDNSTVEKSELYGFLDEMDKGMDIILKENKEKEEQKEETGNANADKANGVLSHEEEKTNLEQSLDKLTSMVEKLKKQLDASFEREKKAKEDLMNLRQENKKIEKDIILKSNFLVTLKSSFEKLEQENRDLLKKAAVNVGELDEAKQTCTHLKQEIASLKNALQESENGKKEIDSWFTALKKEHEALGLRLRSMVVAKEEFAVNVDALSAAALPAVEDKVETAVMESDILESCAPELDLSEEQQISVTAKNISEPDADTKPHEQTSVEHEIVVQMESPTEAACSLEIENLELQESCPDDVDGQSVPSIPENEVIPPQDEAGVKAEFDETERNELRMAREQAEEKCRAAEIRAEQLEVALRESKLVDAFPEVFNADSLDVQNLKQQIKDREHSIGELTGKIELLAKDSTEAQTECREARRKLKERSASLQNLQEKLDVSRNFMNKVLDENTDLKEKMAQVDKENREIEEKYEDLQQKDEAIRNKFEEVTREKRDLQTRCSTVEQEVVELKERLASRNDLMHSLERDRENFKTSLRDAKKEIEVLEERIEFLNEQNANVTKQKEVAENLVEKLKATRNQLNEELDQLRSVRKDLEKDLDRTNNELQSLRSELDVLRKSHSELGDSQQKVGHLTRELRREKVRKEREVDNIKKENVKLQKDDERREKETTDLKSRNDKLEQQMATVKAENNELRKTLDKETKEKEKANKVLEGSRKEGKRLLTLTQDLNAKMANVEGLLQTAKSEKKVFEEELKRLKAANADLRMRMKEDVEDKEELEDILDEMREKRKKLHDEIEKALNERDAFEDELLDLKKTLKIEKEAAEKDRKQMEEKLHSSENSVTSLETKIKELEKKNIQLLRDRRDTKRELEKSEQEASPLLSKIEQLEKENKELISESTNLKRDLEQRKKDTAELRKDLNTTEVKVKAFVAKQKKLEDQMKIVEKNKADFKSKDIELQKARKEISFLMNKVDSIKDKKVSDLRQVIHEDIEAVEDKELHSSIGDQIHTAPDTTAFSRQLQDEIAACRNENARMQARLDTTDRRIVTLRAELHKSKEDARIKDKELHKAREEVSHLMNRVESLNDKKLTELRLVVHEDIEAVEDKELHAGIGDQTDSVPAPKANAKQLEDEITNYKVENMRMQARLEAADNKLMALQEELYKISKGRVIDEKKLKDNELESKQLREDLRTSKQEESKLKLRLEKSDETECELQRNLKDVTREKEAIKMENEALKKRRRSLIEKVMVKSAEVPKASQLPDLDVEPLAKAASMGSARKEIIMLEQHVKDLRGQIRKARDENFDLSHEVSDKERELKQQERRHQEEGKRVRAEIAELEKENAKLRSELHNALEAMRSKSSFSTVQDLKGVNRKAESDMKEVIAKTADMLKRAREEHEPGEKKSTSQQGIDEEKQRIARELGDSERAREQLVKRLKRAEDHNRFLKQIVADMVMELEKVRNLVGFYTGVGEKQSEQEDKLPSKQDIVDTLESMSSADNETLQETLDGLRAKIRELEKGLRDQKEQGDRNLQDLLKSRNSKLQAELRNTTKEKARAREKLRYLHDQLSKILVEKRVIQDIGKDTRRDLQKLVDCLTSEREEKEEISSEYAELQRKLQDSERSEQALKSKLERLKEETDDVYRRKQKLEQELSDIRVDLEVERKQGDRNVKAANGIEADYERSRRENVDLSNKIKQLEGQCTESEQTCNALKKELETLKRNHENLKGTLKEVEDERMTLIQETHTFKLKIEKRNKELSECIESKELEAISLRAQNDGLLTAIKKLEGQLRSLERDKEILNTNVLNLESKRSHLDMVNREQQHEIQELILQKSRENFGGEQLEKLFYENTRIKEQKKMLAARVEALERDVKMESSTRRESESEKEDLQTQLNNQKRECHKALTQVENWRKLLEKKSEESEIQVGSLSLMVEKLQREKDENEKNVIFVDNLKEECRRLEEENVYLKDLLRKAREETQDLKKECSLLRKACQQLQEKRSSSGVGSRGSSFSSTGPTPLVVKATASARSSSSSIGASPSPSGPSVIKAAPISRGSASSLGSSPRPSQQNGPSNGTVREIQISSLVVPQAGSGQPKGATVQRSSSFERSRDGGRLIGITSLTVPSARNPQGATVQRSSSFERSARGAVYPQGTDVQRSSSYKQSASPGGGRMIERTTKRVEEYYRHSTPIVDSKSWPRGRSPRTYRRSEDITPKEAVSFRSSEGDSSICSKEYYCSPILTAVDNCPVHRHAPGDPAPSQCPICKKDRGAGSRRKGYVTKEEYV